MYKVGELIPSLDEFERYSGDGFMVKYGTIWKYTSRGFLISWPYRLLRDRIRNGWIAKAVKSEI